MSKSTELEKVAETTTDVELLSPEEEALIAANQSEVDASEFVVPILKLAQPLTEEVTSGTARPGEFVLSLTGEAFEAPFEFIVSGKSKGRFLPGKKGARTLVADNTLIVPWKDDPFYGKPFAEHPDAEEQYKARVDAGEIEWGSGPPIQTAFNYTGYIVGSQVPVRISLRRTSAPTAKKWNTLLDAVLRGRFWDQVFTVNSEQKKNDSGAYYVATVTGPGRKTTPEEKKQAIALATALRQNAVQTVGEEALSDNVVEPDSNGGMDL